MRLFQLYTEYFNLFPLVWASKTPFLSFLLEGKFMELIFPQIAQIAQKIRRDLCEIENRYRNDFIKKSAAILRILRNSAGNKILLQYFQPINSNLEL